MCGESLIEATHMSFIIFSFKLKNTLHQRFYDRKQLNAYFSYLTIHVKEAFSSQFYSNNTMIRYGEMETTSLNQLNTKLLFVFSSHITKKYINLSCQAVPLSYITAKLYCTYLAANNPVFVPF